MHSCFGNHFFLKKEVEQPAGGDSAKLLNKPDMNTSLVYIGYICMGKRKDN
jgi:hypothetical protein